MAEDIIEVEILPDGTIKSSTSRVSAQNHSSADQFFLVLNQLTGGVMNRFKKTIGLVRNPGMNPHTHKH